MLQIRNIELHFGERALFNQISATIKRGEKVALVGRNGAGKSTLFKVINRELSVDAGDIQVSSNLTLGTLPQEVNFPDNVQVKEEAIKAFDQIKIIERKIEELGAMLETGNYSVGYSMERASQELSDCHEQLFLLGNNQIEGEVEKVLKGLGFNDDDLDKPINSFSGGWRMRVAMARLLLSSPDYLLLDEPTNHLDIESIIWLEQYLKDYAGAVVIISHDKLFMDRVCDRVLELELGKLYDYIGNYSAYKLQRAERMEKLEAAFANQQRVIEQKQRTIDRFMAKASKTKMAQSMQKQLDKIEKVEVPVTDQREWNLRFPKANRSAEVVVDCSNLQMSYPGKEVLKEVEWKLIRGEKVAFVGQNGQGKSTLAKLITGAIQPTKGSVTVGASVQMAYYRQDETNYLDPNKTLLEEMEDAATDENRSKVRAILGAFLFSGEDVEKKIKVLSGGEKSRLAMAKMLLKPINWLVLDEPTNHLDLEAKEVLKRALATYEGTLVLVSHDRDFLDGLTSKTIEFKDGQIKEYLGDINYFLGKRSADNFRAIELGTEVKPRSQKRELTRDEKKEIQNSKKQLQRNIQYLEREVGELEEKKSEMEAVMASATFFERNDHEEYLSKYSDVRKKLDVKTQEWEELVEALEEMEGMSN